MSYNGRYFDNFFKLNLLNMHEQVNLQSQLYFVKDLRKLLRLLFHCLLNTEMVTFRNHIFNVFVN